MHRFILRIIAQRARDLYELVDYAGVITRAELTPRDLLLYRAEQHNVALVEDAAEAEARRLYDQYAEMP